jgi:hypothetical protein
MSTCNTKQNALCKSLGPDYRIRTIDLERCIYRDFGNGFDVEVSGTHTTSERKTATIYLWYNARTIAKIVSDVKRDDICKVVDELYNLTCELLADGELCEEKIRELRRTRSL